MSLLFLIVFVLFTDVMAAVLSFFFGVSHEKAVAYLVFTIIEFIEGWAINVRD